MKTRKTLAALLAFAPAFTAAVRAEEAPVFITLTREETPVRRLPSNVTVVTAEDIRRGGAVTLNDALSRLPFAQVQQGAAPGQYSNLRLRGAPTSNHVQVVVDDQPLGGVFLQDLDIGQIPVDHIERIEIIRGGSSVLYGPNTSGGVVHIITKKGAGTTQDSLVGFEAKSLETFVQRAELRRRLGRGDMALNISSYRTQGFQKNSDGDGLSAAGTLGYSFENGARLSLEASRTDTQAGVPGGTAVPLNAWDGEAEKLPQSATDRVDQAQTLVRGKAVLPLGAATLHTHFYGSNQDYLFQGFSTSDVDKNILGNDTRLVLPGRTVLGAAYERDEYLSRGDAKLHGTNWGLYAQKTWSFGPVDLLPAVRFDQHGTFGNTLNPRFTVVWGVSESVTFSANAARSVRSPTLVNLYQSYPTYGFFANPQLRPERVWSYDAGVETRSAGGARVAVTGHYARYRDLITGTFTTNVNAPRAETSGAEFEAELPLGPVRPRVAYAYQRAVGNTLTAARYVELKETPAHTAVADLVWEAPRRWVFSAGVKYVSARHENNDRAGGEIPPVALVSARITKNILGAEFYFAGDNLGNRRTAEGFNFGSLVPRPGRTFSSGVTLRFQD